MDREGGGAEALRQGSKARVCGEQTAPRGKNWRVGARNGLGDTKGADIQGRCPRRFCTVPINPLSPCP